MLPFFSFFFFEEGRVSLFGRKVLFDPREFPHTHLSLSILLAAFFNTGELKDGDATGERERGHTGTQILYSLSLSLSSAREKR